MIDGFGGVVNAIVSTTKVCGLGRKEFIRNVSTSLAPWTTAKRRKEKEPKVPIEKSVTFCSPFALISLCSDVREIKGCRK